MYIIVTEKYIALTIVLNTIIIAVYKSIAINYYFWGSYLFIYFWITTLHVWERSALEEDRRTLQRIAANEKFCCSKVDDLFSVILVPGRLDDYDDDEEFVDDE